MLRAQFLERFSKLINPDQSLAELILSKQGTSQSLQDFFLHPFKLA